MSKGPELGSADVTVTFCDGQEVVLRTSLDACRKVCRLEGNWQGAFARCQNGDLDTVVSVVAIGIGKAAKELEELVYRTGIFEVGTYCMFYLGNIGNGGKPTDGFTAWKAAKTGKLTEELAAKARAEATQQPDPLSDSGESSPASSTTSSSDTPSVG